MNSEFVSSVTTLAHLKGIDKEVLIVAVEDALAAATKKTIGPGSNVRVSIDRKNGAISVFKTLIVSDSVEGSGFISLEEARKINPNACVGDDIEVKVPNEKFGRITAQIAKQAISQRINLAEKNIAYDRFRDRIGEIVTAVVKAIKPTKDYICEIDGCEAIMFKEDYPSGDFVAVGDTLQACLISVNEDYESIKNSLVKNGKDLDKLESVEKRLRGNLPGIRLSRNDERFVRGVFTKEIPEIKQGLIEIVKIARKPGVRTKIAVRSLDPKIDAVRSCVGSKSLVSPRGERISRISNQLCRASHGGYSEKIDIVLWSDDLLSFARNALGPAKIQKVELDDESGWIFAFVLPENKTSSIGKEGINASLASALVGKQIKIIKEEVVETPDLTDSIDEFERKKMDAIEFFASIEGITEDDANMMVNNGFLTKDGILAVNADYLAEQLGVSLEEGERIWNCVNAVNESAE